jgi:polysaccharide chain length determinant protein (PEP-CTERM system associated)
MLGHRQLTTKDYAGILKRRFKLILLCAIVFLFVGIGVSFIIPPQYVSQTLVLIEQQRVPTDYVTPVVTEEIGERLASMKEQILSRSRIEPIIQRFKLFAEGGATMDERLALTQKAIDVKQIPAGPMSHGMPGFYIIFKAHDPHVAQQVCGEITSLFVSENLIARQQSAEGTTEFLRQQLADSKKTLDEQDAKLAEFERKYFGELPEQEATNANTLQALTTQLDAATQSLDRLQQNETFLNAVVSQQTAELHQGEPVAVSADARNAELTELVAQQHALEMTYTPDHPDVKAIERKIAEVKAQIAAKSDTSSGTQGTSTRPDPPQLQEQKAQLRSVQQSIVAAKREQSQLAQEIRVYESRIQLKPQVEEEYKEITRNHETALQFYNGLLKKMNESSMATALEHRQEGEQFRVMDAPNLPDEPTFPNRAIFAGGGLVGGLAIGLLFAALLEYRDATLRDELDIWTFTKLPTLAVISHIEDLSTPLQLNRKNKSRVSRLNHEPERAKG